MRPPLVQTPRATDLTVPVGTVMRPTLWVESIDSLARSAQTMRENGGTVLPVVDGDGKLVGILTDAGLARALGENAEATDAVAPFAERAETLPPYATAAEALRLGEDGRTRVVVDDANRVVGLVSAVDLWPRRRTPPRPAMVGGMATPFGVYLTTGSVSAGAPWWALMATGASMCGMFFVGLAVSEFASRHGLPVSFYWPVAGAVFLFLMRVLPLSGTHGAEHQVVHAIEREEPLVADVVRRMPRVHPRCGTNLMVGLALFGLGSLPAFAAYGGQLLGVLVAIAFAIPLGSVLQRFVTTKTPSDRQLAGAIRAGEQLLARNATAHLARPNPLKRIWSMGLVQVVAGSYLVIAILYLVKWLTGVAWLSGF